MSAVMKCEREHSVLSPRSYNKLDNYNSTKESLLHPQICLRDPHRWWAIPANRGDRMGKNRDSSCRPNPVLGEAPEDTIAMKGQGATPTGQIGGAETATGPECLTGTY